MEALPCNLHCGCHCECKTRCDSVTWIQDTHTSHADAQLGDDESILVDGCLASKGYKEGADGVISCRSEGAVPFLPMIHIPVQGEPVHDIRAQEVGKFLDGALDEHSMADVEVEDIGFQRSDVLMDSLDFLHEEGLCKVSRAHMGAQ